MLPLQHPRGREEDPAQGNLSSSAASADAARDSQNLQTDAAFKALADKNVRKGRFSLQQMIFILRKSADSRVSKTLSMCQNKQEVV